MYTYQLTSEPRKILDFLCKESLSQMNEKISPEERLFNVIQQAKSPAKQATPQKDRLFLSLKGFKNFFTSLILRFKHGVQERKPAAVILPGKPQYLILKKINHALSVVLAVLVLITLYYAIKKPNLSKIAVSAAGKDYEAAKLKPITAFNPLASYASQARKRDIFHQAVSGAMGAAGSGLQSLAKDLAIAGIYQPVNKPSEVMIEDKATKKTYFLEEGDEVKGFKVKSILKDRVVLQYGDEEVELF